MGKILVELDSIMTAQLERVAPARSRRRSEFIRAAVREALWALEEKETAEAYGRLSDAHEAVHVDPNVWGVWDDAADESGETPTAAPRASAGVPEAGMPEAGVPEAGVPELV